MTDLLVVGLGNPGAEYHGTRHNVGVAVVELLAQRHGGSFKKSKDKSLVAEVRIGESRVALAFPQTYMNESGQAVGSLVRRHKIDDLHHLVVVHDELDLPVGTLRVKVGGGLAGHNGLRSIKSHLHSDDFIRVRIGVGKPPTAAAGADYVLRRPGRAERDELEAIVTRAADAVEMILRDGADRAMAMFNGPARKPAADGPA
jgi:PTH1 family peptidyl-tRNA hydrolase